MLQAKTHWCQCELNPLISNPEPLKDNPERSKRVGHWSVQVRCPARIFHGAKDDVVPPYVAQEVVSWLESKDVQLTVVKVLIRKRA